MSDPTALNIPVHQAITSDMLLGLKPAAPKSRSYRISIAPTNKSVFVAGDQMVFDLPVSRKGSWLDQSQSYLKFSVQVAATAAFTQGGTGVYIDNTAYSFIQRLDVYNSSNLLESINEYGQIANLLLDTAMTQSDKAGLSCMIGCNATPTIVVASTVGTTTQIPGDRSGFSMAGVAGVANISTAVPYTFCLPILSGVIGVNASKMIPVGNLYNPIHCEFYLAAVDDAIYSGTAATGGTNLGATWQIVNAEMVVCYVEIQDDSFSPNSQETQYISTTTYRHASTYIPAATAGEFTTLLPFRAASLTALYARFRNFATAIQGANNTAAYRKGSSINPNLSSYYYRIGSAIYPNKPIYLQNGTLVGSYGEAYAELLKSFHALSSSIGNTAITYGMYNVQATATQGAALSLIPKDNSANIGTSYNAFAIGLECQSMSNRNDLILSGISTLNSQVYFTGIVGSGLNAGGTNSYNYTMDNWAQMDMILVIDQGILMAKY